MTEREGPFHADEAAADIVEEAIHKGLMSARAKGDEVQANLWLQLYKGQVDGSELDYRPEDIPDFRISPNDGDMPSDSPFGDDAVPGF